MHEITLQMKKETFSDKKEKASTKGTYMAPSVSKKRTNYAWHDYRAAKMRRRI
jgi:hypothetical protein